MASRRGWENFLGGAHVVDGSTFRFLLNLEVQKAQRLRYCVSLLCLAADLPRAKTAESTVLPIANRLCRYLRSTDAITPYAHSSLAILLVDADTAQLPSILGRLTEHLEAVPWSAGGSCYPRNVTRADDMLHQAVNLMVEAKKTGSNRLLLPS